MDWEVFLITLGMLLKRKGMEKVMNGVCHILKQKVKVKLAAFIFLFLFLSCFLMNSCFMDLSKLFGNWNPQGDWTYDLVGDYSIWRINSVTISLDKVNPNTGSAHVVIGAYVTCFACNDHFIAVRKLDVPHGYSQEDILEMDFDQAQYFLVNVKNDQIYGPFSSEAEFQAQCDELNVGDLGNWIPTYPAPEGAMF